MPTSRRLAGLALAALVALPGCRSDEETLMARRQELRRVLDEAYAAYGGGELANEARAAADGKPGQDGTAAQLFGEVDRSFFEQYCLARGRGERPLNLSGKLSSWIADPKNAATCERAAALEIKVTALERKLRKG